MKRGGIRKGITMAGLALAPWVVTLVFTPSLVMAEDKAPKAEKATPATGAPGATRPAMPMGAPKPPPELDAAYKVLEGSWTCETTFLPDALGPGSPETKAKTTIKFKKDLDGFWYRGDYEAKKTKGFPGMKGTVYLGHDGKQLLTANVDAMGGLSAGTGSASGDTLTFTSDGHMMGMNVKMRETIEKKSAKAVSHRFEVDMGKGFQTMGEDVCKR